MVPAHRYQKAPGMSPPTLESRERSGWIKVADDTSARRLQAALRPGYDRQYPTDVGREFIHVLGEEGLRRLVGHFSVARKYLGCKPDVRLGRGHLPSVAEGKHAAQALLRHRGADLAARRSDHGRRHLVERDLAPRPRGPVDSVLERSRN